MISKSGTTPSLGATLNTSGSKTGLDSSPIQCKDKPTNESHGYGGNTESAKARGNIRILALPSMDTRLLHEVFRDCFFGCWDTDGVLHPNQHCTQFNWKRQGLYLNAQYTGPGIADILAVITKDESYERFLRILDRLSRRPLPVFQEVL
jgi:hypothetical protein